MSELKYAVKTSVFEGPLDLLLELVTKRKLFINDVSLAAVTDDFIKYIEDHEEFPIGESAEFIVVASTLILVKSRSLLPGFTLTSEEEESIHDLEERLALYSMYKDLAKEIKAVYGVQVIFEKMPKKDRPVLFSPDSKTDTANLSRILGEVLESLPKSEVLPKVAVKKMISLEEMMDQLSERIAKAAKMSFKEFSGHKGKMTKEKKVSVIVGFLAMLELVKRGAIRVSQEGGEIEIETEEVGVPNYV